jgi:hypothetical protein
VMLTVFTFHANFFFFFFFDDCGLIKADRDNL